MGETITLYVVVDQSGNVRRNKRKAVKVYTSLAHACNGAKRDGDSVVEAYINLNQKPRYIRGQVLDGGP